MAEKVNVGKELLQVPFAELVKSMATGIAEAQLALDMTSLRVAQMMAGKTQVQKTDQNGNPVLKDGKPELVEEKHYVDFDGAEYSLLELGFTPTFYQFVDTIIEIKMSVSVSMEERSEEKRSNVSSSLSFGGSLGFQSISGAASLNVSTVSASFASKFQYSAEGASLMRTKLVPVPAPAILEERIRRIADRRLERTT